MRTAHNDRPFHATAQWYPPAGNVYIKLVGTVSQHAAILLHPATPDRSGADRFPTQHRIIALMHHSRWVIILP